MAFAFRARNLGPLREIDWRIPRGVSVIVGPNGVGKSTLLRLPEFAQIALNESLNAAVTQVFEGTAYLRHHGAHVEDALTFGASVGEVDWDVVLNVAGGALASPPAESARVKKNLVLERLAGSPNVRILGGENISWGSHSLGRGILDRVVDAGSAIRAASPEEGRMRFGEMLQLSPLSFEELGRLIFFGHGIAHTRAYATYRYEIVHIAKWGSQQSSDISLQPSGENVFPLLRNWRDRSELEPRYEFVLSTLREAFPHLRRLDFEQAGQTVTVAIVDNRYPGKKTPISRESTGFLTALLHLSAIASCEKGGLVTLDEIETSLHPHAIKVLLAAFRSWAKEHDLSIVLATQSETVLDQFHDEPEKIYVLEPKMTPAPRPLTELFSREWLSQFSLGDLFGHLEYGSNAAE